MSIPITIRQLSTLEGTWRVDWFGDVAYPDLSKRQYQPSVAVRLSRHPQPRPISDADKREVWLPIGLLPDLKVGDLWLHGQRTGESTAPSKETFTNLTINAETTHFYKAGSKPIADKFGFIRSLTYWLPLDIHPWHLEHTHSNCVVISAQEDLQIIIPCMELIRFYFGSSSSLLSMLFKPTLSPKNLAKQYIKRPDDSVFLRLAEFMSGSSAADVARILYSSAAWRAACLIGKSSLKCSSLGLPIYPKCHFPFEGTTDLHVSGQWLSNYASLTKTFIVYEILSCSHEFPFKSIRYVTSGWSGSYSSDDQSKRRRDSSKDNQALSLTDSDPDEKRKTKFAQFESRSSRFPDLEHKTIFRNPTFSISSGPSYSISAPSEFSVGVTGRGKGITPVDIEAGTPQRTISIQELPSFFRLGLATLQNALRFTLMIPFGVTEYTFPIPLIHDRQDTPYPGCFISDEIGQSRPRLMGYVQVEYAEHTESTLILEPIEGDVSELISFSPAEETFDLDLVRKQLQCHWEKDGAQEDADDEIKSTSVTIG